MKKHFFILTIAILTAFSSAAQIEKRSAEVGVFFGGSYYIGDLNPLGHFNRFTKPAGGIIFRYNYNPRLSLRANALVGNIEGHDEFSRSASQQQRNLSFKSRITEISAQLEFNFLDYEIGNDKRRFSPYIFFGLAGFAFKPQAQINNNWVDLQPLGTEGQGLDGGGRKYKLVQISIPFGVGIKVSLSKSIGLSFEWGMRKTFTDYLDDVSGRYYDPVKLAAAHGANAAALSDPSKGTDVAFSNVGRQRGNPTTKDWYSFSGIVLSFKLKGKRETCAAYAY